MRVPRRAGDNRANSSFNEWIRSNRGLHNFLDFLFLFKSVRRISFACVYLLCLVAQVSSLNRSPAGRLNHTVEQVILFFHFNSFTTFRGWTPLEY